MGDDLGAGGLGEAREVQPVGGVAHGVGGRGHGHGDAVVAEAHADVAHDQRLAGRAVHRTADCSLDGVGLGVGREVERAAVAHHEVADAEGLAHHGQLARGKVIDGCGIVAVLLGVLLFGLDRLVVGLLVDGVAKDLCGPVVRRCHEIPPCALPVSVIVSLSS